MRRKVFDILASAGGVLLVVVLLVAGALLLWGASFANSNVHDQLAQQEIFFPAKGSPALASPKIGPYLDQYAGQQLTTGPQAEAYANHFIAVHLSELPEGGVYAKLSAASLAHPNDAKLAAATERRSAARPCAAFSSRRTASGRSARSRSGRRSPRSCWRSWSASSRPSASGTPGGCPSAPSCSAPTPRTPGRAPHQATRRRSRGRRCTERVVTEQPYAASSRWPGIPGHLGRCSWTARPARHRDRAAWWRLTRLPV